MAVKTPSLQTDQLLDRADEVLSTAAGNLGALADKAPDVDIQEEVGATASRIVEEAEELLDDLSAADATDRRLIFAAMVVAAVLTLAVVVVARRRRVEAMKNEAGA